MSQAQDIPASSTKALSFLRARAARFRLVAAAVVALVVLPLTAHAGFGSDARRGGLGSFVQVYAGITAPANCAHITGRRNGAPAGRAVHPDAKAVTIIVAMSGGACGKRNLTYGFQTSVPQHKSLLQLFFVTPNGKLLKNEKISIANP